MNQYWMVKWAQHCFIIILIHYKEIKVKKELADSYINDCLESISKKCLENNFGNGLTGIVCGLLFLRSRHFVNFEPDYLLNEIDEVIFDFANNELNASNYDYIYGGLGGLQYFLERMPNLYARNAIEILIRQIDIISEKIDDSVTWRDYFTTKFGHNEKKRYNFGLAHGIPSIIYFLSRVYNLNINRQKCFELLHGSINWLLQNKFNNSNLSLFPSFLEINEKANSSRLGWCYGDLGIANALWYAGISLGNNVWKTEAISILMHACGRKNLENNFVFDACVCHGAAGIHLLFNRFYQSTKLIEFKYASNYWLEQTLEMSRFEDGFAGYKTKVMRNNEPIWINSSGFLYGISGIGLCLISAISNVEPKWDRILLLS
ncbi:MAG: lanthionine synthetase C family protein [Saprospiraceae bacterium]|nr:lanthionine synthetase C family protein [Saprospiraceae bacterium]